MGLFKRNSQPSVPVVRGPSMVVPDPHTHRAAIVPNPVSGGFPESSGTYIVHQNTDTQDAGTVSKPENLSYQKDIRKPTYWRGTPENFARRMFDEQWLYTTRQSQVQETVAFGAVPGKPGSSPMPAPERPQYTQSTSREVARFDWRWAKQLTGRHFSMASNIRAYPIGGMQPVHRSRNTFRLEPPQIDARMVDYPPEYDNGVQTVQSQDMTSRRVPLRRLF